jgi:hypothetical protein
MRLPVRGSIFRPWGPDYLGQNVVTAISMGGGIIPLPFVFFGQLVFPSLPSIVDPEKLPPLSISPMILAYL